MADLASNMGRDPARWGFWILVQRELAAADWWRDVHATALEQGTVRRSIETATNGSDVTMGRLSGRSYCGEARVS